MTADGSVVRFGQQPDAFSFSIMVEFLLRRHGSNRTNYEKAEALLAELRAGSELRFRSKGAAPSAGLVSSSTYLTGRFENGKLVPILLDESFERALGQCGL